MTAEYFIKDGEEFKKVDEVLLAQPDVDKVVETRLERQKKQYADYDDLKEKASKVDSVKTEYEDKLKEKDTAATDLQSQLKKAQLETEKVKVVHEFGLSSDLEEFVIGETPEELRKRAEKLSKGVTGGKIIVNKNDKDNKKPTNSQQIAGQLFGSKKSD